MLEAPPYIALSYTWGRASYRKGRPSPKEYSVLINDTAFPIQQNLHDALTNLAHRVVKREAQLWVDAIYQSERS